MTRSNQTIRGLYAIADYDSCLARKLDPTLVALSMVRAGVPILQLRAKSQSDEVYLEWAKQVAAQGDESTQLVLNDRVDLAMLSGVSGVHVGQDDLPVSAIRRLNSKLFAGLSTHNLEQLLAARKDAPDYLAFGPIFSTQSKKNPEPQTGLDKLAEAHRHAMEVGVPLVGIGGVTVESLPQVAKICELVAAISLLLPDNEKGDSYEWIECRCGMLHDLILQEQQTA